MPRQLRFVVPGVAAHISQRGHNGADCFRNEGDYLLYLLHLRELSAKHGCAMHAYCLMTNHVHMLLTPSTERSCTNLMRDLGQRYVQFFNRRYGRVGTLWQGRFFSSLAESARYVLGLYRYIERNPVRAHMVKHAGAYPWSSHAANTGAREDKLISPHVEYMALAADPAKRQACYQRLVEEELEQSMLESIREAMRTGYPLASDAFKAKLGAELGRKTEPGRPGRPEKQRRNDPPGLPEIGL
ncbi:MAG TPA: transposase [Burkholderiales bacterium]|nr:transposase [Burkholderiales bacterium]